MRKLIPLVLCFIAVPAVAQSPSSTAVSETVPELAHRIAIATVQPEKVLADSLAAFDRQFDAGVQRSAAKRGRDIPAAFQFRGKAAGHSVMERELKADALPKAMSFVENEYRTQYTEAELRTIAEFWTSPAGRALTREAQSAGLRGVPIRPPAEFSSAITRYFSSPAGQKENGRRAGAQAELARIMTTAMQRILPKTQAAVMAAAQKKQP